MAHIIILDEWKEGLDQLHDQSEIIAEGIENEEYTGKKLEDAEALITNITNFIGTVNTNHRTDLDGYIAECQNFLR